MVEEKITPKERAMNVLHGKPVDYMPMFSGMGSVMMPGLIKTGQKFARCHLTGEGLANAAAATSELYGWEAAVTPFDMTFESEACGNTISLYEDSEDILYPTIPNKIWATMDDVKIPDDMHDRGRMPEWFKSIKILKEKIGDKYAVASWSLGPFTLAGQILELDLILKGIFKEKEKVAKVLDALTEVAIETGRRCIDAGVDYMTLREPGVAADLLSPRTFKQIIQPRLTKILDAWNCTKVLHICGTATPLIEMMMDCGADALSFDVKTDMKLAREKMGTMPLLGNFEVFYVPCQNPAAEAAQTMRDTIDLGVDAVWPGCDMWPDVIEENIIAMKEAVKEYGTKPTAAVGRL